MNGISFTNPGHNRINSQANAAATSATLSLYASGMAGFIQGAESGGLERRRVSPSLSGDGRKEATLHPTPKMAIAFVPDPRLLQEVGDLAPTCSRSHFCGLRGCGCDRVWHGVTVRSPANCYEWRQRALS